MKVGKVTVRGTTVHTREYMYILITVCFLFPGGSIS